MGLCSCFVLFIVILLCLAGPVWQCRLAVFGKRGPVAFAFRWFVARLMSNIVHHRFITLPLGVIGRLCSAIMDLPGPEVIKLFSCSAHLSMKFSLLINIVGIFIFISREIFMLSYV